MLFTERTSHDELEKPAFYRKLQWSVVGKASNEVKRHRMLRKHEAEFSSEDGVVEGGESEKSRSSAEQIDKQ